MQGETLLTKATTIGALSQLFAVVFAATVSLALPVTALAQQSNATNAIRPFRVNVPEESSSSFVAGS